jgi:hypothetical protein
MNYDLTGIIYYKYEVVLTKLFTFQKWNPCLTVSLRAADWVTEFQFLLGQVRISLSLEC